jgi:hypothetical protein
MGRIVRLAGVAFAALMLILVASGPQVAQAQSRLCFSEVPDCIEGRFAEYWQQNGGLPVFGFPIGAAKLENVGGGQFLVQPFERNRFELHPENQRPYDVLLGRLGDDRLRQLGRPWENEPKAATTSQAGCQYFAQTGHLVCGQFLNYWRTHGLNLDGRAGFTEAESLALFGLPLTEAKVENSSDGKPYLTQWFERGRFELHPEISADTVLLGLLGRETGAAPPASPPAPQPTPPPAPQPPTSDVPASVSARVTPNSGPGGTVFEAQGFGFRGGENVGVYVTAPDQSVFGAPFQIGADGSGTSGVVTFSTGPDFPAGIWAITFEGVQSKHKAIAYFRITAAAPPPPGTDTSVPESVNAIVDPETGRGGTVFSAIGFGFRPGENIGVYVTGPDQRVQGAPFQVRADDEGISEIVSFNTRPGSQTGIYAITFEGVDSKAKAIAYFRVLP